MMRAIPGLAVSLAFGFLAVAMARGGESVTFERDVEPILTRAGCNAGACHGKSGGQNGFALSLLGFDREFDHKAIARDAGGRRVSRLVPDQSLLIRKATAEVPHGGGRRIEPGSPFHDTLKRWVVAGMPRTPAEAPKWTRIDVSPTERTLRTEEGFPIRVTAWFEDGTSQDVTHLAAFTSSESTLVAVDPNGQVKAGRFPGEATISARFDGLFTNCDVSIPLTGSVAAEAYASLEGGNFLDGLIGAKLRKLGLAPSPRSSDAAFLRRAHLDVIGRLPTPDEARAFLADPAPDKRARLVDRLLDRPEYADHWANKWMDLLRPNPYRVGIKAVFNLDGWIRSAFRDNLPYDEFARQIVTAQGSTFEPGAATIFRDRREPQEIAPMLSQLFLGIRLDCAKCHHHPFEPMGQEKFYEFAAYFARVGRKGTGLSPPISGGEEIVYTAKTGSVTHPLTGQVLAPKPLYGSAPVSDDPDDDPREALARWMTGPDNRHFPRVMANRVWADLMGRGIVDPVDDLRPTNPPSNGPLLDALAEDFRGHGYDLKHLLRTIMASSAYGLASEPNDRNVADTRNFSRHYRQRLRAEVLLDAISDVTGVAESFAAAPPESRSTAIWTHRVDSLFLDTFGRPDPNQDPPCERTSDSAVVQALHLMNAPGLQRKVASDKGTVARLASGNQEPRAVVEELYLLTLGRLPSDEERQVGGSLFTEKGVSRREAVEDLLWALLNSAEFVLKD